MKKILFSFFILPFSSLAQTSVYHPFPDSNAAWNIGSGYLSGNTPVQCNQWDWMQGDTLLKATLYHKLYRYQHCSGGGPPIMMYNGYLGAIRQDSVLRTVYYWPGSDTTEYLLYDFKLSVGDTLPTTINHGDQNRVVFIDSILLEQSYRKRFWLSEVGSTGPSWDSAYTSLIEGVGSTQGLVEFLYVPFESGSALNCFWKNGNQVYGDPLNPCSFVTEVIESSPSVTEPLISPNPSQGIFTVSGGEKTEYVICDVFGREVYRLSSDLATYEQTLDLSSEPKGVYFLTGITGGKIFSGKIVLY